MAQENPVETTSQDPPVELQRVAMKALIVNEDNGILLLEEAVGYNEGVQGGLLQLPGGRIEIGEDLNEGLRREVFEETGLEVIPGAPVHYGSWSPKIPNQPRPQIVGIFVSCLLKNPAETAVRLDPNEHQAFRWVSRVAFEELRKAGRVIPPDDEAVELCLRMMPHQETAAIGGA